MNNTVMSMLGIIIALILEAISSGHCNILVSYYQLSFETVSTTTSDTIVYRCSTIQY